MKIQLISGKKKKKKHKSFVPIIIIVKKTLLYRKINVKIQVTHVSDDSSLACAIIKAMTTDKKFFEPFVQILYVVYYGIHNEMRYCS